LHIVLQPLFGWIETNVRGVPTFVVPAPPAPPDVIVHAGAIVGSPDDESRWRVDRARADLPPDARVEVTAESSLATHQGWPILAAHCTASDPSGAVIEQRIVAYYNFLHLVAVVLVRAQTSEAFTAHRGAIDQIIRSAQPDFRDGAVLALSELWQL